MKKPAIIILFIFFSYPVFAQTDNDTSKSTVNKIGVSTKVDRSFIPVFTGKAASCSKEFNTFIIAMLNARPEFFNSNEALTVFAPDNRAFEKLPPGTLDSLYKPSNKAALITLLNNHIIHDKLTSKEIARQIHLNNGQALFATLAGSKLTARININRNIVLTDDNGGESIIKIFDIQQGNKLLFIVDSVINYKKQTL